jgi:carbon catabolite-derepressing protein kinase
VSKIGILPSSLPAYHKDFMEAQRSGRSLASTLSTAHSEAHEPHPQTDAEKAETARRLNPHSRSQLKLDEANKRPAGMTPVPQKKAKPTKWQFGIRSRNQPLEAIGCIYRALQKLGAEWIVDEDWEPRLEARGDERYGSSPINLQFANRIRNDGSFVSNVGSGTSLHHSDSMAKNSSTNSIDPNAHYKLPADPWVLRVRWRKDGMYPPGTIPPGSSHSSSIDLRRQSIASLSSASGSVPSQEFSSPPKSTKPDVEPMESVVMHLDIQLYEMEPGVYLVDFKCAGYETNKGLLLEEKDVTSPFPFLDLASKLIIQLAEAD